MRKSPVRNLLAATGTAALGVALAVGPAHPAAAATYAKGYHIKNSSASDRKVYVYERSTTCGTAEGQSVLLPSQTTSNQYWDSIRVYGTAGYEVDVYDNATGSFMTTKKYAGGACAPIGPNSYLVFN